MARVRRRVRRARPSEVDEPDNGVVTNGVAEELDPAIAALIDKIATQSLDDWGIFTTGSPVTAQAKKPDGTYRTVPLDGKEEFSFAGLRMGKRGKMIFEFRPIDPTYSLLEFDETKVFEAVSDLETKIVDAIEPGTVGAAGFDKPGDGYAFVVSRFKANFRKKIVVEKQAVEAEKVASNVERMAENPLFGSF